MPRLPQSRAERQRTAVLHAIDTYIADFHRADPTNRKAHQIIANRLGFAYTTLRSRQLNPGKFTLEELQGIANVLNISLPALLGEEKQSGGESK